MTSNNVHTARVLEYYPRALQIAHTASLCKGARGIPTIPKSLGGCESLLTTMEADLIVDRVLPGGIIYFHHNYHPHPVLSGVINVVVRQWARAYSRGGVILTPHQSEDRYSPCVLTGSVYAPNEALIYGPRPKLYLEDKDGYVYEFSVSDIGTKIMPVIEECYLVIWSRQ